MNNRGNWLNRSLRLQMMIVGPIMVIGVYGIVALHVYAYISYIIGLLYKRLGTWLAIVW